MNAKLCKKLRAYARTITIGRPSRELMLHSNGTTLLNNPATTRGTYRQLKRARTA